MENKYAKHKNHKKMLSDVFGKNRVRSVKLGRGTSRHWVDVEMFFPEIDYRDNTAMRNMRLRVEKIIEERGEEFDLAYYPDEMLDTMHSCLTVSIKTY
jgi:hypothetical protein